MGFVCLSILFLLMNNQQVALAAGRLIARNQNIAKFFPKTTPMGVGLRTAAAAGKFLWKKSKEYRNKKMKSSVPTEKATDGKIHEGHARVFHSRVTRGTKVSKKRKRKGRKGKKRKRVKKTVHGRRISMELFSKGYMYPNSPTSNSLTGHILSTVNQVFNAFIPFLCNGTMQNLFHHGETSSGTGQTGIFDPPAARVYNSGVLIGGAHNFVKAAERMMIDNYYITIDISNTNNTKVFLKVQEWICNQSSDVDIISRNWSQYNTQYFSDGLDTNTSLNLSAASAIELFKNPGYSMSRVPGFYKYWKKGRFCKSLELLPGEEARISIPIKNLMWNQKKFLKENESGNNAYEYHKNISRFIQLRSISGLGRDNADSISAYPIHGYNFRVNHKITCHRVEDLEPLAKSYYVNMSGLLNQVINGTNEPVTYNSNFTSSGTVTQINAELEPTSGNFA